MHILRRFLERSKRKGFRDTLGVSWIIATGLLDCFLNPFAKRKSRIPKANMEQIRRNMEQVGLEIVPYKIDLDRFYTWLKRANFPKDYMDGYERLGNYISIEKAFEHYLGAELLELNSNDILIDVAAGRSPWWNIAPRLYGCAAYCLDLVYPPGINGHKIGCYATKIPLKDGFATKLALHCAFETFEGEADVRFISEAARILSPEGRIVILSLYMSYSHIVWTGLRADRRGIDYQDAQRVWQDERGSQSLRFASFYSVSAFNEWIVRNFGKFSVRIYWIENISDVHPGCYCNFAAVFEL